MTPPDTAPPELSEILHFLSGLGRVCAEAYIDDGRITPLEMIGMVGQLRDASRALNGMDKVPAELANLTPEQSRKLAEIPAQYFARMIPAQHEAIALAGLACLPSLTNFIQTIRSSAALAADFPGPTPRAIPQ